LQKVNLIVEILKVLSERGGKFITTTEIFKELVKGGVLNGSSGKERAERKRLQRLRAKLSQEPTAFTI